MPDAICYATGETAHVGDRLDDDGLTATVEEVILSPDDAARWGLNKRGLMLKTEKAGLVFEPYPSDTWDSIIFLGRGV